MSSGKRLPQRLISCILAPVSSGIHSHSLQQKYFFYDGGPERILGPGVRNKEKNVVGLYSKTFVEFENRVCQ